MDRPSHMRRNLLKAGLALGPGAPLHGWARAAPERAPFLVGANLPWIAYGHDFGSNAWGHDGMSTAGWTRQTAHDSVGFTAAQRCAVLGPSGKPSLCITARLDGTSRARRSGEVYIDLTNHAPRGHTAPLQLTGALINAWVCVPHGAAGQTGARNGVQLFAKSAGWHSCYGRWHNIDSGWEGQWRRVEFDLGGTVAHRDRGFDASRVIAIGFKLGINSESSAKLAGEVMLSDLRVTGNVSLEFDLGASEIERDLRALRNVFDECPHPVARVFVFADGRASPEFDARGAVSGLGPEFSADFDALLAAAQAQRISLMPVLLDFHWCDKAKNANGAQLGGRAAVIRDPALRRTFFDRALRPFLERYGKHPAIHSIDLVNEPEWALSDVPKDYQVGDPLPLADMQAFVGECTELIHRSSMHKVTLGSARRKWVRYWRGLGLDLYQFHWYDKFAHEEPFPWSPVEDLKLDKPCLIGEVPTRGTRHSPQQFLHSARAGGYAGVLFWSYRASDAASGFADVAAGVAGACRRI